MKWSFAYHFHQDKDITISQAMKLRKGNDPRAGDLHCHKECFESKNGSPLRTRKEGSDGRRAHFARWAKEYTKEEVNCGLEGIAESKRESMDYANYYSNFDRFLRRLGEGEKPYFVQEVETMDGVLMPDFIISHSSENPYGFDKTHIHIVDDNNRRKKRFIKSSLDGNKVEIVIRISEYTEDQLIDFQRGGIERLEMEWGYILNLKSKIDQEISAREEKSRKISEKEKEMEELRRQRSEALEIKLNSQRDFNEKETGFRETDSERRERENTERSVRNGLVELIRKLRKEFLHCIPRDHEFDKTKQYAKLYPATVELLFSGTMEKLDKLIDQAESQGYEKLIILKDPNFLTKGFGSVENFHSSVMSLSEQIIEKEIELKNEYIELRKYYAKKYQNGIYDLNVADLKYEIRAKGFAIFPDDRKAQLVSFLESHTPDLDDIFARMLMYSD